jgi:hypothetical protein
MRRRLGAEARVTAAGYQWDAVNELFANELQSAVAITA